MRVKGYICIGFVCLFYWVLDSIWSYISFEFSLKKMIFCEPTSYLDTFLLKVSPYQIVSRIMVVVLFAILGAVILEFIIRRYKAERERKQAHDSFMTVLNSIDATVYVADMESHKILFMNQLMIDSFGGDFTGHICYEAFTNNNNVCDHCTYSRLTNDNGESAGVVVWEGYNSKTKSWYINYDRAIKWIDGRLVYLQIATDVTQIKELRERQTQVEEQLRQSQKLEAIGTLAGGIAHDFNNILSAIFGYTDLARLNTDNPQKVTEHLDKIRHGAERAKNLVRQILSFSRRKEQQKQVIQASLVVKEALSLLRSSIPKSITIKQDLDSETFIIGDPTEIHQIVMNLCTNGYQAMQDDEGALTIQLKKTEIYHNHASGNVEIPDGIYVHLQVSDTGSGLDDETRDKIFEPYFTTKKFGEGTGLGLATVHGIVKNHNGFITVSSEKGSGTAFDIFIPEYQGEQYQPDQPGLQAITEGAGETIMMVDDEDAILDSLGTLLANAGYTVSTYNDPRQALSAFQKNPEKFDLIISDLTMPRMTGNQLAVKIMDIQKDISIILISGNVAMLKQEENLARGIKKFIAKPVQLQELLKVVREVLDK